MLLDCGHTTNLARRTCVSLDCLRSIASWGAPAGALPHTVMYRAFSPTAPKPASQCCQPSPYLADWRQVPNLKYLIHLWADQVGYDMHTGPPSEKILSKAAIQARPHHTGSNDSMTSTYKAAVIAVRSEVAALRHQCVNRTLAYL